MEEQEKEIIINYNNEQLGLLFEKYFKTLEEQEKEKELQLKKEQEVQELTLSSSEDLQIQLIEEIRELKEYQQYNNNLIYFGIVITGVVLVSSLMYKFLKNFM